MNIDKEIIEAHLEENIEKIATKNSIMESRYNTMISEYEKNLRTFNIDDLDI